MANRNNENNSEINLGEIYHIIWLGKYWIICFVIVVCVITVVSVYHMDNIYESKAILKPSDNFVSNSLTSSNINGLASLAGINLGNSTQISAYDTMNAIIKDSTFFPNIVVRKHFEKKVFDDYDEKMHDNDFVNNLNYNINRIVLKSISFKNDDKTGLMTISYENRDRFFSKIFIENVLVNISACYKKLDLLKTQKQIDNLKNEISKTDDITLKNKLADAVSSLIQHKVVLQANQYYGFDVIVQPAVADSLNNIKPNRILICVVVFIASLLMAIIAVFVVYNIRFNTRHEQSLMQ